MECIYGEPRLMRDDSWMECVGQLPNMIKRQQTILPQDYLCQRNILIKGGKMQPAFCDSLA